MLNQITTEMVNEFWANGASERFDALNRAFSKVEGPCLGFKSRPCSNDRDDDKALCDECQTLTDLQAVEDRERELWEAI